MKRYIALTLLITSLISFPMSSCRYHTWFLLKKCMYTARFEVQSRKDFLTLLGAKIEINEKETTVLSNDDLAPQGTIVAGLTSLVSPKGSIFCTTLPSTRMAHIDIYTEEMTFNKREIGEVCRKHFGAESHNLAYTLPD